MQLHQSIAWWEAVAIRAGLFCEIMKRLANYIKNGYAWEIIQRVGNVVMAKDLRHGHFEVFRVQSHNGRVIAGKEVPPAEFPPSNTQWGKCGWSATTFEAAEVIFAREGAASVE